ncbi:MAG: OsmC family protein [Immundisolibacteraceae bacterium]|nr:OsmC family protein [Immundisolibacteraceae bacterium]
MSMDPEQHSEQPIQRRMRISSQGDGYLSVVDNLRGSQTISDEPVAVGGNGEGFGPFELLAASLGTCTVATLKMYARRKQWPLTDLVVELKYQRAGEGDLTTEVGDQLRRCIKLIGPLDKKQSLRLAEIARRCPVARVLSGANITIVDEVEVTA